MGIRNKPYKDWVTLEQILEDGWSRGFHAPQTKREAREMGFEVSLPEITVFWERLTWKHRTDAENFPNENPTIRNWR